MVRARLAPVAAGRPFAITNDRHAPHVLYLGGHLDAAGAADLDVIGARALAQSSNGLVLDVAAVVDLDADGISCINRLGAAAKHRGSTVTIRTPGAHLDTELANGPFDAGVRTEVTEPVPTPPATIAKPVRVNPPPGPDAGVPRRAGRGFIASFGEGRTCASPGCATRLSQYNGGALCGLHDHPGSRTH